MAGVTSTLINYQSFRLHIKQYALQFSTRPQRALFDVARVTITFVALEVERELTLRFT
jgi:hypothetical protein